VLWGIATWHMRHTGVADRKSELGFCRLHLSAPYAAHGGPQSSPLYIFKGQRGGLKRRLDTSDHWHKSWSLG
jgi:hypothetical protein